MTRSWSNGEALLQVGFSRFVAIAVLVEIERKSDSVIDLVDFFR